MPVSKKESLETIINNEGLELSKEISSNIDSIVENLSLENFLHFFFATLGLVAVVIFWDFACKKIEFFYNKFIYSKLPELKPWGLPLITRDLLHKSIKFIFSTINLFIKLAIFYFYLTYSFSIFPKTHDLATRLWGYVKYLMISFSSSVISFVPNLLKISFIIFLTYYALKLSQFLVRSLYLQNTNIPGLKREWIFPTYQIARFFIVVFAVIMIFPYLPGSDSPAFQGISVFVGLLVTLGSSSAISNIIAGVVLTYMTPFRQGNRVRVGDIVGTVTDMSMLVTRIRTIKNEDITVPNSIILSKEMINYSSSALNNPKLLLHIKVGLGYDVDRLKAEELLLKSCNDVEAVLLDPEPFVLVLSLGDYAVSYELNFTVENAQIMQKIRSDVQKNILDNFSEAGVEILSPAHMSLRRAVIASR